MTIHKGEAPYYFNSACLSADRVWYVYCALTRALLFQLRASKVLHTLGIYPADRLTEMFSLFELWWSAVLGAIGGIIGALFVKLWENGGAANVREGRGQNLPQEHDERFG